VRYVALNSIALKIHLKSYEYMDLSADSEFKTPSPLRREAYLHVSPEEAMKNKKSWQHWIHVHPPQITYHRAQQVLIEQTEERGTY